jgi:hypothetical protein
MFTFTVYFNFAKGRCAAGHFALEKSPTPDFTAKECFATLIKFN